MVTPAGFRSGFAAIVGRPNVGKSTLLNALVGHKLAIVSDKPQTTRNRILAVLTREKYQVIFLDTPGIHKPKHRLGEYMVKVARSVIKEVEVVLHVVDATAPPGRGDQFIAQHLREEKTPVLLVLNKIDMLSRDEVSSAVELYKAVCPFAEIIPVSALYAKNLDLILDCIYDRLPEGPKYYPDEMITDQPEQFVMRELIREKILQLTREEVPHSVAVDLEEVARRRDDLVYVRAVIYVERESQKGIIIGDGGRMLKQIGQLARQDIECLLGSRIYLDLWVKMSKDWRNKEEMLRSLGYQ